MMRVTTVLALVFTLALYLGCSSSSSDSTTPAPPAATTGTLTIAGSATLANALTAPMLALDSKPTISGTPTSVKIKAYRVYLAQNADCSNPVLVGDKDTTADYQELTGATRPILFSAASVTPGTYNCLILKVSDVFKFTPDAAAQANSAGVCVAGTEVNFDIHKTETPTELWYDLETGGTNIGEGTHAAASEQTVFMFLSTDRDAARAHNPLIASTQGMPLLNPVTITAGQTTKSAFVIDPTDRMSVVNIGFPTPTPYCWLEGFVPQFVTQ
jgi:hypothetical protein